MENVIVNTLKTLVTLIVGATLAIIFIGMSNSNMNVITAEEMRNADQIMADFEPVDTADAPFMVTN